MSQPLAEWQSQHPYGRARKPTSAFAGSEQTGNQRDGREARAGRQRSLPFES